MSSWTCKRSWSTRTIFLCKYICIFTTLPLHNIGLSLSLYNGVPADSSVECEAYAVFAMLVMVWFRHHHIGRLGDHEAGSYMPAICFDFMTSTKGDIILTNGYPTIPGQCCQGAQKADVIVANMLPFALTGKPAETYLGAK